MDLLVGAETKGPNESSPLHFVCAVLLTSWLNVTHKGLDILQNRHGYEWQGGEWMHMRFCLHYNVT